MTSELCTAECRKGTPLELSTGSHRHESVVQSHIWNEARTAVVGESFILCQNYVCVCTHVGTCLCMYILQPRFLMCQSSLLWAGVLVGYGLWITDKKLYTLHAVDIATCNVQGFLECLQ